MRIRKYAVKLFFLTARNIIIQRVQTCLVTQQQARFDPYRVIHALQATLATQPAPPGHADIQKADALPVDATEYLIAQDSVTAFQHIVQARKSGNRNFTADLTAISGKIRTVDERPCIHEARMIYFSPLRVKKPKEYC